ncbi:MAG TPA: hypothetical protein VGM03_03660 [Phycisphaerae bacterium]|jgi:dienelactone hydrolase
MTIGKLDRKASSGARSPNGREKLTRKRSERDFLADQAADAKTAMIHTLGDVQDTLERVADLRSWAKQHPWLFTGSAIAVGFATGALLTPAPPRMSDATPANSEAESQPGCQARDAPQTKKSFLLAAAGTLLAGILQTVVQRSIAAAVVPDKSQSAIAPRLGRLQEIGETD